MSNKTTSENTLATFQSEEKAALNSAFAENPVIQRALRRLKDSQTKDNHVAYYTKHGSHSTHSKGYW